MGNTRRGKDWDFIPGLPLRKSLNLEVTNPWCAHKEPKTVCYFIFFLGKKEKKEKKKGIDTRNTEIGNALIQRVIFIFPHFFVEQENGRGGGRGEQDDDMSANLH